MPKKPSRRYAEAMEQAEQMDTTIGISSFDIRRAFDSVSKGLIHLG